MLTESACPDYFERKSLAGLLEQRHYSEGLRMDRRGAGQRAVTLKELWNVTRKCRVEIKAGESE